MEDTRQIQRPHMNMGKAREGEQKIFNSFLQGLSKIFWHPGQKI